MANFKQFLEDTAITAGNAHTLAAHPEDIKTLTDRAEFKRLVQSDPKLMNQLTTAWMGDAKDAARAKAAGKQGTADTLFDRLLDKLARDAKGDLQQEKDIGALKLLHLNAFKHTQLDKSKNRPDVWDNKYKGDMKEALDQVKKLKLDEVKETKSFSEFVSEPQALLEEKLDVKVGEEYQLPYHGWRDGESTKGGWRFEVGRACFNSPPAPKGLKVKVTKVTPSKIYFDVLDDFRVSQYKFNPFGRHHRSGEKTGAMYHESAKNLSWVTQRDTSQRLKQGELEAKMIAGAKTAAAKLKQKFGLTFGVSEPNSNNGYAKIYAKIALAEMDKTKLNALVKGIDKELKSANLDTRGGHCYFVYNDPSKDGYTWSIEDVLQDKKDGDRDKYKLFVVASFTFTPSES